MDNEDSFGSNIVSYFPHKFKVLWDRTKEIFNTEIKTISDINTTFYEGKSKLFKEIEESYPEEGKEFIKIYKNICSLVLDIENIFKDEIKILKSNTTDFIILNRKQVALIFILGFFNIFSFDMKKMQVNPRYNFNDILNSNKGPDLSKGRSFLNYITVIGKWLEENNPLLEEKISFIRENKDFNIKNFNEEKKLCGIDIIQEGSLFDSDASFCIDFANMFIGGGVLSGGCVQEEILFAVEPEAIVSIFLMEKMEENDAIRIDNLIQYSKYSGYGWSFKYEENAIKDNNKIIKHNIIAIDAICSFSSGGVEKEYVERDLIKAYIGFNLINFNNDNILKLKKTIATGNWGCGAFGGDFELKFIQQWLAASYAGVEKLYYYTFKRKEMDSIVDKLEKLKLLDLDDLYLKIMAKTLIKGEVLDIVLNNDEKEIKEEKNNKNFHKKKPDCCFE